MALKTVFIDWHDTLSNSKMWDNLEGVDNRFYHRIQKSLFQENPRLLNDWMRGHHSAEHIVGEIAKHSDISYNFLMMHLEESCKSMKFMYPEALVKVEVLRQKGIKVLIATDNMDTFNRWTVPALKLDEHFDGILNSADKGHFKKDITTSGMSLFFHHYLSQNALDPEECLLIDDHDLTDVTHRLGMRFSQITEYSNILDKLQKIA
jgi:FMN phosphatase YigB (HAD superfamily)